jgi:nucleoside 2-deoxyribosyltransferase
MDIDAASVHLPGIPVFRGWGAPKRPLEDSILIISSVAHTAPHHRRLAALAVQEYRRADKRDDLPDDAERIVRTRPVEFKIPAGAAAGKALNGELVAKLRCCVGAIAFVDDMRPNIAYELGFFHGMGRPVLLLSSTAPGPAWSSISDLAGSAIAQFTEEDLTQLIHEYLDDLFLKLELVETWPTYTFPHKRHNLLSQSAFELHCDHMEVTSKGPYGRLVRIFDWEHPLNIRINKRLSDKARFKVAIRSPHNGHFAVYFELAFQDTDGKPKQVWLGLSSWLARADYRNDERNIPTDPASHDWRFVTGTFAGLERQGHLGMMENVSLKRVRFRAGEPSDNERCTIEIGYLEINGLL